MNARRLFSWIRLRALWIGFQALRAVLAPVGSISMGPLISGPLEFLFFLLFGLIVLASMILIPFGMDRLFHGEHVPWSILLATLAEAFFLMLLCLLVAALYRAHGLTHHALRFLDARISAVSQALLFERETRLGRASRRSRL